MPRFFFHIYDDVVALDDEGLELADIEAARREAVRGARSLACEEVLHGHLHLHHRIEIASEAGDVVAAVAFKDAVAVEP
jgi:hypothetical protein